MENSKLNLVKFKEELMAFDWYYGFSDNSKVFNEGERKQTAFIRIANENPEARVVYEEVKKLKLKLS